MQIDMTNMYYKLAQCHEKIARGQVWCVQCGNTEAVEAEHAFKYGWPQCCGETMTIDSPEERQALEASKRPEGNSQ